MEMIYKRLQSAFSLTLDLASKLEEKDLKKRLGDLPSNTIGEQFWCIIGARESYLNAILNEEWMGFSCSLRNTESKSEVLQCLSEGADSCLEYLDKKRLNEKQMDFLLTLYEHEIQHHGQLIRYIYGNKLKFPKSWNERYTV